MTDRSFHISTGSSVKHIITDEFISLYITNTIKPFMRQSQYAEALKIILESIYELLSKQDNLKESKVYQKYEKMREEAHADVLFVVPYFKWEITYFHAIIFIILACVGIYVWYQHRDVQQYDRAREHLAAIHAAALQKKFQQTSCPICFEEFSKTSKKPTSNLHCGHCFCTECLDAWFSTLPRRDQVCPICRQHRDDLNNIRGDENANEGKDNNERKDDDNKNDNDINNRHDNHFDKTTSQNNANYYGTDRNPRYRRNQQNMNLEDLLFRNELLFRLNRLRILYPRHIDNSMIHRWSDPQYRGSFYDDTSFQRRNPSFSSTSSRSSSSSSSSSSRSSFSFGGGSSFRGGGGGGRW